MKDYFNLELSQGEIRAISNLGLAHIGDCVYELLVRSRLICSGRSTSAGLHRETVKYVERHRETDEIFVLLSGECTLLIGGDGDAPAKLEALPMEPFKVYNVRKGVWHNLLGQPGMRLFLVENADVSMENSDHVDISPEMLP